MQIIQIEEARGTHPESVRLPHDDKYEQCAVFANEKYVSKEEATMPLFDFGFMHSDVTYEAVTLARGRIFRLPDHLLRFAQSCKSFRLRCPYSNEKMVEILLQLIRLTGLKDGLLWWCVTRGLPKPGASAFRDRNNPDAFENRFYAGVFPYSSLVTQGQYNRGLDIAVSRKYIRIPPRAIDTRAKNNHWMDMKLSLFEAGDLGKDWSVLLDSDGNLTEAPGANIFVVKDKALYTPDSGCLDGITRKTVIELAEMIGVPVHVEKVSVTQLRQADDAFLTSSAGGVIPINSVDDVVLGGIPGPGELTIRFHNLYWEKVWGGWKSMAVSYQGTVASRVSP